MLCAPALAQTADPVPRPEPLPDEAATVVGDAAEQAPAGVARVRPLPRIDTVSEPVAQDTATDEDGLAPTVSLRPDTRSGDLPEPAAPAPSVQATAPATAPEASTPAQPSEQAQDRPRRGFLGGLFRPRGTRPEGRPDGLEQNARAAATRQTPGRVAQPGRPGQLCGVPGLMGDVLDPIPGRIQGCGIAEPVRLRSVDGIALSQPATINCDAARALHTWVNSSAIPTVGREGGGIRSLRVVASYACRTRNSRPGARLSEHATGNAIDIAGIGLADGSELTVLGGWRERRAGPLLQEMHRGACGTFGTVLGPNSDRFHQDHFHFDVAGYRSGPFCR